MEKWTPYNKYLLTENRPQIKHNLFDIEKQIEKPYMGTITKENADKKAMLDGTYDIDLQEWT